VVAVFIIKIINIKPPVEQISAVAPIKIKSSIKSMD
jgi:hypothetical protein